MEDTELDDSLEPYLTPAFQAEICKFAKDCKFDGVDQLIEKYVDEEQCIAILHQAREKLRQLKEVVRSRKSQAPTTTLPPDHSRNEGMKELMNELKIIKNSHHLKMHLMQLILIVSTHIWPIC